MIADFLKISFMSMRHREVRSWLTILGIVIGIAAIVALISISQGLENAITEQFSKMGVQDIRVTAKGLRGPPTGTGFVLTTADVETVEKVKGVDYVLGLLMQRGEVEYSNKKALLNTMAYPTDLAQQAFIDVDLKFADGRPFSKGDKGNVLLGWNVAKDEFDKEIRVKNNIKIEDKNFKVIGIIEKAGLPTIDDAIIMTLDDSRDLYDVSDEVSAMMVHLLPGVDMEKAADMIHRRLKRARDNENFEVFTPKQILDQLSTILGILEIVLAGIASISLLVGGIGILNAMYTSVLERTKEIGIMKAVGATNANILSLFLLESGFIGAVGGLVGAGVGIGVALAFGGIANQLGFSLLLIKIDLKLIFFALAFAFIVGVISGTLPAVRASKLKPVDALRYE
ncbi:MAG: ABC transporter permease [Nanoarchaeota archaeon]|nr:ABC transporter permease [Nanoarchaeota archaeon]MCG2718238.1 ABC transporter permease [Nanoarchaeota archaeon]